MTKSQIQKHPIVKNSIYWSPSRHRTAQDCLKRYHYKYSFLTPVEVDESIYIYGRLVHKYLETNVKPDTSELLQMEKGIEFLSYLDEHYEMMKDYAKRLKFSKQDKVEQPFLLPLKYPSGKKLKYNIFVYGIIDRVLKGGVLIDYKTSAAKLSPNVLKKDKQFTFYIWAHWMLTGKLEKLFVVNLKKGNLEKGVKPEIYLTPIEKTLDDFEELMTSIEERWAECVETQDFEIDITTKTCYFCPYKQLCNDFKQANSKTN